MALLAAMNTGVATAQAQAPKAEMFPPPPGKGLRPAVLVVSGQSGAANYSGMAREIAARGFTVHLVDGNDVFKSGNAGEAPFRSAVAAVRAASGAPNGKIGVVGFSLGGAAALTYATKMPEEVAAVVAVYPFTSWIEDPPAFVRRISVPTLVLAAVEDSWKDCCAIETARALNKAAQAGGLPMRLVEYPKAGHGFVLSGPTHRAADAQDALKRTAAQLRTALEPRAKSP